MLHLGCQARQFHACAGEVVLGGHPGYGQGVIDYEKLQRMTELGVTYVTKMKKNRRYEQKRDIVYPSTDAMAARREQEVEFVKTCKDGTEVSPT